MLKLICNFRRSVVRLARTLALPLVAFVAAAGASFAAAPESYLEYVSSDGVVYIDPGVIGKAGTKVEAGMMWGSISGDIVYYG